MQRPGTVSPPERDAVLYVVLAAVSVLGLVVGSFINVVVDRVPAGIPLRRESRCPRCDAPVRWWQKVPVVSWISSRGKCAHCAAPIDARYPFVEALSGALFALVAWWFLVEHPAATAAASVVVTVAYLYFAAITIALTLIDLDTHRLPNAIVMPSYAVAIALFTVACLLGAEWAALVRAVVGMAILYAFYFVLRLARPDGMGGGDVKLAGVVGLHLAWIGWTSLIVGAFAAFVLGGLFGVVLLVRRRADRSTAIPFGPWMLIGAWVGIVAGESFGRLLGGP